MRPLQDMFRPEEFPDLLVGLGAPDDAAVWRLRADQALVVTADFFTPIVDDAYDYGAIAAANALSDLYAMGARPLLALNIAAVPPDLDIELIQQIFRGSAEKVRQAGAVLAGGHTVQDKEPKVGLVAVGLASPNRLLTKGGARPGDLLVLTKPLGTGVTTTALKRGSADAADVSQAVDWMTRLNEDASALALEYGVRGATDITGYGLLGHGVEMADASGVRLVIQARAMPLLRGASRYVHAGCVPGGSADNQLYFGPRVRFDSALDEYARVLLFDAQTSGGLLLSLPADRQQAFMADASSRRVPAWIIGKVETGGGIDVLGSANSFRPSDDLGCVYLPEA
jgi:selenide, water dikinase